MATRGKLREFNYWSLQYIEGKTIYG